MSKNNSFLIKTGSLKNRLKPINTTPVIGSTRPSSPQTSSNFQKRMEVKKLMAARDAGGYVKGSMLERRLNQKIANLAAGSYSTNSERLKVALQRQSDSQAGIEQNNYAQNLRDKITNQKKSSMPKTPGLDQSQRQFLYQKNGTELDK